MVGPGELIWEGPCCFELSLPGAVQRLSDAFANSCQCQEPAPLGTPLQIVEKFVWRSRVRGNVIQTDDNCDKDVFNGDLGQIVKIDPVGREVAIGFGQRDLA